MYEAIYLVPVLPPTDPNAMIRQSRIIKPLPFASRPINLQS